jgi:hypothetical protein
MNNIPFLLYVSALLFTGSFWGAYWLDNWTNARRR